MSTPMAVHPDPPRSSALSRRVWSVSIPVASCKRSDGIDAARRVCRPASSISKLVEMRATSRNLEPGNPVLPATTSSCCFSTLESVPLGRLAKVATDSAIVFRGEVPPLTAD
ncbi:hypothetical protein D1007_20290 [Hordeum vulgare]|nr:hypothetical protein D1007_20290 [Hordeum vulgare]KAI4975428.1 hypothetical protein ZWY2020_049035 [Hordeum vulgare]